MRTSENIDLLAAALAQAQAEIPAVKKNKVNPQFKSEHSGVDAVMIACLPYLSKHGLCLIQPLSNDQAGGVVITTRLMHKSGQWIEESFTIKPDRDNPQGRGSAATYGRRYGAKAMLGLADEDDDDDANAATNHTHNGQPEPMRQQQPRQQMVKPKADPFSFPITTPSASDLNAFRDLQIN